MWVENFVGLGVLFEGGPMFALSMSFLDGEDIVVMEEFPNSFCWHSCGFQVGLQR